MGDKVLKPRIRFKGFTEAWEQRKLGDLGEIITGTTPSTNEQDNYGGTYLFVSPADIQENRFINKTITTLTLKGFDKCRKIKENSIMFVSIGSTIGKVAQNSNVAVTNQQINSMVVDEKYDNNFIYSMLENKSDDIKKQASTQAVPIINKTNFSNIDCYITTNYIEQSKIGDSLLKIDNLITLHQHN